MRVLIIGQGLAGTLASHAAFKRGWEVHVIDAGFPSASAVAAGMFNPMSFRRIVEVWQAEEHLRAMERTYGELETLLGIRFLHHLPIQKVLPNGDYAADWHAKSSSIPWLVSPLEQHGQATHGTVEGGGWINLPLLLSAWRQRLISEGRFTLRPLSRGDDPGATACPWDVLIDCRGTAITEDDHLPALDVRKNRGELLSIRSFAHSEIPLPKDAILNFGKWTIPLGQGEWRLGASYEWNREDLNPTPEIRDQLLNALRAQFDEEPHFETTRHEVGIRPVARDRRPLVGAIPGKSDWYVFNGLGTRGVLIAPLWAERLMDIIAGKQGEFNETRPSRLLLTP